MWSLNQDPRMKGGMPHKMEVLKVMVIGFCNSRARLDMATKSTKKKEDAQDSKKKCPAAVVQALSQTDSWKGSAL